MAEEMNLSKPIRKRDPKYLEWIRLQPSVVSQQNGWPTDDRRYHIEPNHIRKDGEGGMGTKPDDSRALPFMGWLHDLYHSLGKKAFEEHYGINLEAEIKKHNTLYRRTRPKLERERPRKIRKFQKKPVWRWHGIFTDEGDLLHVVESIGQARSCASGAKIRRVQIRIEGSK